MFWSGRCKILISVQVKMCMQIWIGVRDQDSLETWLNTLALSEGMEKFQQAIVRSLRLEIQKFSPKK